MILYIDTTAKDNVKFSVAGKEKKFAIAAQANNTTLALLEKFLREQKISQKDIKKIQVHPGPGSFNGVRTGLSIAQALGLAWNIPVIPVAETGE